jgi:hypothetical protein
MMVIGRKFSWWIQKVLPRFPPGQKVEKSVSFLFMPKNPVKLPLLPYNFPVFFITSGHTLIIFRYPPPSFLAPFLDVQQNRTWCGRFIPSFRSQFLAHTGDERGQYSHKEVVALASAVIMVVATLMSLPWSYRVQCDWKGMASRRGKWGASITRCPLTIIKTSLQPSCYPGCSDVIKKTTFHPVQKPGHFRM